MPRGGQNIKPTFQVVREGNPGKRPVRDSAVLTPSDLREPDWNKLIIGRGAETVYIRGVARETWREIAPALARSVGLVGEQQRTLIDYCVTWARIVEGERALSREGVIVKTAKGMVKNGWTTVLNQYRSHFRSLTAALGLDPSAISRIGKPDTGDDEDDSAFD